MDTIEVSVVIPTYNRRELLEEMLKALGSQTLPSGKFEVIVSIDGSSDGTFEALQTFGAPYSLVALSGNRCGVSAARNRGARAATGEVLLFLDDDVLPDDRLLEEHMFTQTQNPKGVVLGRLVPAEQGKRNGWNVWEDRVLSKHYRAVSMGQRPPTGRRLYSGNFSVWREPFFRVGGFNEELRRGEDTELGFRLEEQEVPFYFNAMASAIHRGYRSFSSWRASAYEYGRIDVSLAARTKRVDALDDLVKRYGDRPLAVQWAVSACLGRPGLRETFAQALRAAALVLGWMRLWTPAHKLYSMLFNLHYWHGVADELGDRQSFRKQFVPRRSRKFGVRTGRSVT